MKIVQAIAQNIKNLRIVEINPNGGDVIVTGDNGSGKTSILETILMVVQWSSTKKGIKNPIGKYGDKATAYLDLGDIKCTMHMTGTTHKLEVRDADGQKMSSPQKIMDKIIGSLMDPHAFSRMSEREQYDMIVKMTGIDTEGIDIDIQECYDSRYAANQQVRMLNGSIEKEKQELEDLPEPEDIDVSALTAELKEYQSWQEDENSNATCISTAENTLDGIKTTGENLNSRIEGTELDIDNLEAELSSIKERIEAKNEAMVSLGEELKKTKENYKASNSKLKEAKKTLAPREWEGTENIAEKIENVVRDQDTNRRWDNYKERKIQLKAAIEDHSDAEADYQRKVDEKTELIAKAKFPITNMGLNSESKLVTVNDVPYADLSAGEQLKAGTEMALAFASESELKAICIRDASLLDKKALKWIRETAGKAGIQTIIELVESDEEGALVFEEGRLRGQDPDKVEIPKVAKKGKAVKSKAAEKKEAAEKPATEKPAPKKAPPKIEKPVEPEPEEEEDDDEAMPF